MRANLPSTSPSSAHKGRRKPGIAAERPNRKCNLSKSMERAKLEENKKQRCIIIVHFRRKEISSQAISYVMPLRHVLLCDHSD
jgi:hypothetical protein